MMTLAYKDQEYFAFCIEMVPERQRPPIHPYVELPKILASSVSEPMTSPRSTRLVSTAYPKAITKNVAINQTPNTPPMTSKYPIRAATSSSDEKLSNSLPVTSPLQMNSDKGDLDSSINTSTTNSSEDNQNPPSPKPSEKPPRFNHVRKPSQNAKEFPKEISNKEILLNSDKSDKDEPRVGSPKKKSSSRRIAKITKFFKSSSKSDNKTHIALIKAISEGNIETLRDLIDKGCNPNEFNSDSDGSILIHLAAQYDHIDIIDCLISNGADIDAITSEGNTALHIAIEKKNSSIIRTLLDKGANPNLINNAGSSPLHIAAVLGDDNISITKVLVEYGADVNKKTIKGKPHDLIKQTMHPNTYSYLMARIKI